jgi:hypothetical protein
MTSCSIANDLRALPTTPTSSKIISLKQSQVHRRQCFELRFCLNPFRKDLHPQIGRNVRQPSYHRLPGFTVVDASQKLHVELDQVGLEFGEQSEPGIARPEVVERRQETEFPIGRDDPARWPVLSSARFQ